MTLASILNFLTVLILWVIFLALIPLIGTRPDRFRDYLVWAIYLALSCVATNFVLQAAVDHFLR